MPIVKTKYGEYNGEDVWEYTLKNTEMTVSILSLGGIIKNIILKGRDGVERDVVLGHADFEAYKTNSGYMGALIGRYANRLDGGEVDIDGEKSYVTLNKGTFSQHGGDIGFDKKLWEVTEAEEGDSMSLVMSMISPDGEEGYPGTASVQVTYTLTGKALSVNYRAVSDKDTVFNMTNHSYFNLNGHTSGTVDGHVLQLNCGFYTPNNASCMPTGEIMSVSDTPMDFRKAKPIGQDIASDFEQVKMFGGYDHNFVIDGRGLRQAAVLTGDVSGITMTVNTDKPGVQVYTGNGIHPELTYKDGAKYTAHSAVCLETQLFPNSVRLAHFPSPILRAGEEYNYTTEFVFSVE